MNRLLNNETSGNTQFILQNDEQWKNHAKFTKRRLLNQSMEQDNILEDVFFSKENIVIINKQCILAVFKKSNGAYLIGPQKTRDMTILMRWVYSEYGKYLPDKIAVQIRELNQKVVDTAIGDFMTNIEQKIGYLRDISRPLQPPPLAISTRSTDRTLPSLSDKTILQ
jgi:hypothetical protein